MKKIRIGIDLGGTKIESIALDDTGKEHHHDRIDTPAWEYETVLDRLKELVFDIERQCGQPCSVGIGMPGAISPKTGLIKNANSTYLNGRPLKEDLEARLERPVRMMNDANCFTLSESIDGAGAGFNSVFGVILGTGIGGGISINRQVIDGCNRIAGEWGHSPLPWPQDDRERSTPCYCGKQGCIESLIKGPALEKQFVEAGGPPLRATQIALLAEEDHPIAGPVFSLFENRLARGLAGVVNMLDPDAIILGGGLSRIDRLYRTLPDLLQSFAFSDSIETKILPPRHGDASGVRGAAWLWDIEER
ncbi:ROK family protein [Aestuariispira insulae]|uniref:Fructokinase n=1 Tax=Aestuariispira insulae TaxID=1461337 RepID=A0A3D9HN10_9PROT|nr:ROK family protein [Aestuariispira insulae]RED50897.1 fructokinase [Aestuariispira insulae]